MYISASFETRLFGGVISISEKLMNDKIITLTDATFESEIANSSTPILVDFWAEWCGPCKMLAPILDDIADEYAGKITVAKLNVDENSEVTVKLGVRGIPTLLLFKGGEVVATKVGSLSKRELSEFIDANM